MAAFEDNVGPDLDQFQGCQWTEWQNAVEQEGLGESSTPSTPPGRQDKEVATLKREDLGLFGFCPAKDNFYVVVCKHCRRSIKPQTFHYHVEKHHGGKTSKMPITKSNYPAKAPFVKPTVVCPPTSTKLPPPIPEGASSASKRVDQKKLSAAIKLAMDKAAAPHGKSKPLRTSDVKPTSELAHVKVQRSASGLKRSLHSQISHSAKHHSATAGGSASKIAKVVKNAKDGGGNENPGSLTVKSTHLSNGPVVLLKKSPKLETTSRSFAEAARDRQSPPPSPNRQYKHHHNPQREIVKAEDRGAKTLPEKTSDDGTVIRPKKNIPLKAREYDPNKHCGVWVVEDMMNCTRSLTCKTHAKSLKKKVAGRRKPYEDLLKEHALTKQRLKEQDTQLKLKLSLPITPKVVTESPKPVILHKSVINKTLPVNVTTPKAKSSGPKIEVKPTLSTSTKPKHVIHLFPRSTAPRHIDCWKESAADTESELENFPNQHYISHHPKPLMVNAFNGWSMDNRHTSYNRKSHLTWRRVNKCLSQSQGAERTAKAALFSGGTLKNKLSFKPLSSAKFPEHLRRTRVDSSTGLHNELVTDQSGNLFTQTYASSAMRTKQGVAASLPPPGRGLTKSSSIDNSAMVQRSTDDPSSRTLSKKINRAKRFTVEYGQHSNSTLQEARHQNGEHTEFNVVNWPLDGSSQQQGANKSSTSIHDEMLNLSSFLTTGQDKFTVSCAPSKVSSGLGGSSGFKVPGDINHIQASGKELVLQHQSNSKRPHSAKSRRNSALKTGITVKHEGLPLNGLSNVHHKLPLTVVSGKIGALIQKHGAPAADGLNTVALDNISFTQGSGGLVEQVSRNANNSNNFDLDSSNALERLLTTTPTEKSTTLCSDLQNDRNGLMTGHQVLGNPDNRTSTETMLDTPASTNPALNHNSKFCNVNYVQLTPELRPLDPGGGHNSIVVSSDVSVAHNNLLSPSSGSLFLSENTVDELIWNS